MNPGKVGWSSRALWALLLAAVLAAGLHDIWNGDLGFHLASGRVLMESGLWPRYDSLSYITQGQPWINFQWLYDLLVFGTWQAGGAAGVVWLHALVNVATFAVCMGILGRARRNALPVLVLLLALLACEPRFTVRPHAFERLFLVLFLAGLFSLRGGAWYRWWWLVPLQALWANMNGSHLLALPLAGVLLLEQVLRGKPWQKPLYLLAALGAASLLNPYGFKQPLYLFRHHRLVSQLNTNPEWMPLSLGFDRLADPAVPAFLVLSAFTVGWLWTRPRRPGLLAWVLVALALVGPWLHARALGTAPLVLAVVFLRASRREAPAAEASPGRFLHRAGMAAAYAAVLLVLMGFVTSGYGRTFGRATRFGWSLAPNTPGWGAGVYLGQFESVGRLFNTYRTGGWLSWWVGPRGGKVFIDPRDVGTVYTPGDLVRYRQVLQDSSMFDYLAGRDQWEAVVLGHDDPLAGPLLKRLSKDDRWVPGHIDASAVVFIREDVWASRGIAPNRHRERWATGWPGLLGGARRAEPFSLFKSWSLALSRMDLHDDAVRGFEQVLAEEPGDLTALTYLGTAELNRGNLERAEELLTRVIQRNPDVGPAQQNLAILYMNKNDVFLAIHHGEEAVRIRPNDPVAWLNLAQYYQAAGQEGQAERCNRKAREVERRR